MLFFLNDNKKAEIESVKSTSFQNIKWKEKDLENLIANNITRLIPENQLMVLFQEKPLIEAADIYALNKNGDLYIFELKRWESKQENVLQVLRYGQKYGQYKYDQLQDMLRKYEKDPSLDLAKNHYDYFKESIDKQLEPSQFNRDQYFVVITNGTDVDTRNAIKYWQDRGLKIDSLIYKIYSVEEKNILEFNPYNPGNEVIIEEEQGYFIVNTNLTFRPRKYMEMLDEHKAAAYGDRKFSIKRIKKGNTVFLYQNSVGIIAYGKTTDHYKTNSDDELYVPLNFQWKINPDTDKNKAVHGWEINRKLGSQYAFRQTVFSIPKNMADAIKELAAHRI
jgi:hypothetical protein